MDNNQQRIGESGIDKDWSKIGPTGIDVLRLNLLDLIGTPLIGRGHRGRMIRKGLHDAATALDVLSAQRAEMLTALMPFAKIADVYEARDKTAAQHHRDERGGDLPPTGDHHRVSIALGDCRKARAALSKAETR